MTFSLRPEQRVRLGVDRRVGEDPGRLLEGRRRQPRLGGQRGLRDAHQHRTTRGRRAALGDHAAVLRLEARPLDQLAGQQLGVAGLDDRHPLEHLADDDLDVLVVDRHALRAVDLLDLVDQVHAAPHAARGCAAPLAGRSHPTISWWPTSTCSPSATSRRDRLEIGYAISSVPSSGTTTISRFLSVSSMRTRPADLGDRRDALGLAGLEQLDHTRQTVGDVVTGDTTGVEGTHRELRAGLADRLGGDDADRLADVDELAGRQRAAVAGRAGADLALAGQHASAPGPRRHRPR